MKTRLLLVDDDHPLREMLRWALEELGYRVTTASCCREALLAMHNGEYDFGLLDNHLPDGLGIELTQHLHREHPSLPIVIYSGEAAELSRHDLGHLGVREIVAKPITAERLDSLFQSLL